VPGERDWEELDRRFRKHGVVDGGSLGPPADEVILIGHMGAQADLVPVD
jgi:hypothetical protein